MIEVINFRVSTLAPTYYCLVTIRLIVITSNWILFDILLIWNLFTTILASKLDFVIVRIGPLICISGPDSSLVPTLN